MRSIYQLLYLAIIFHAIIFIQESSAFDSNQIDQLSQSTEWKYILQYRSETSRVKKNSPFFISPEGYRDPRAELLENLEQLMNVPTATNTAYECRFPYRTQFLQHQLGIKPRKVDCPELKAWHEQMEATEVVLVFASQFISNPGSVMGHTFLLFKNPKLPTLLNMTFSYAAEIPEDVGALDYVVKGLFGGFPGIFSELSYYQKVHEYNNMEQRDLWEYKLDLSQDQIHRFINYLWELHHQATFDYYFLDENCSFMVLAALQPIFPNTNLTDHFYLYAVPHETIKVLNDNQLITSEFYRASIRQNLISKYQQLKPFQQSRIKSIIRNKHMANDLSKEELETLIDFFALQKQRNSGKLQEAYATLREQILLERSQMPANTSELTQADAPASPLTSHQSMDLEWHSGIHNNLGAFQELNFFPGIHRRNDKENGFLHHSSFNFFEIHLRYYHDNQNLQLNRLVFVDLASTQSLSGLDPGPSWRFELNYEKHLTNACLNCHLINITPAIGVNYSHRQIDLNLFAVMNLQQGNQLPHGGRIWPGLEVETVYKNAKSSLNLRTSYAHELIDEQKLNMASLKIANKYYDIFPHYHLAFEVQYNSFMSKISGNSSLGLKIDHDF